MLTSWLLQFTLECELRDLGDRIDPSQRCRDENDDLPPKPPAPDITSCINILGHLSSFKRTRLRPSVPLLPVEIVDRIISELDDDDFGWEGLGRRLINTSLVCKTWYNISQPYLYRRVTISSRAEGDTLLPVFKTGGTGRMVRHIIIEGASEYDDEDLVDISTVDPGLSLEQLNSLLEWTSALETLDISNGLRSTTSDYSGLHLPSSMLFPLIGPTRVADSHPSALRSFGLGKAQSGNFNCLRNNLVCLEHASWNSQDVALYPPGLQSVPSLVSLDISNPSAELLLGLSQHQPHLQYLSIPLLDVLSYLYGYHRDEEKFYRWMEALSSLKSVEELAITVSNHWYRESDEHPRPALTLLRHLPLNLRHLIYASPSNNLRLNAPNLTLQSIDDPNVAFPVNLKKINYTTDREESWPSCNHPLEYLKQKLAKQGLSQRVLEQFSGRGIEVVVGEAWKSTVKDVVGAFLWGFEEYEEEDEDD